MDAGGAYNPRTVEEVFKDFKGRRAGMIKALTTGKNWVFFFIISLLSFSLFSHRKIEFCDYPFAQMFRSFSDFVIPVSVVPLRFVCGF